MAVVVVVMVGTPWGRVGRGMGDNSTLPPPTASMDSFDESRDDRHSRLRGETRPGGPGGIVPPARPIVFVRRRSLPPEVAGVDPVAEAVAAQDREVDVDVVA